MNAIVSICHFCEQHGPSVLMCTQPYWENVNNRGIIGRAKNDGQQSLDGGRTGRTDSQTGFHGSLPANRTMNHDTGLSWTGAVPDASRYASLHTHQVSSPTHSNCRACNFTNKDEPGLVSYDRVSKISYISTKYPKDSDLKDFICTACKRSLSCEICPGQEGIFYFGDEVNGHAVSYTFQVMDAHARGFQSRFSFVVLSWNRVYLLNLWPCLVSNLSKMANRIKQFAFAVYQTEMGVSTTADMPNAAPGSSESRQTANFAFGRGATPPPSRSFDNELRSLIELTKDDRIFYRIHAWFTWLLRVGSRRWTLLPSLTAPPDEDLLFEEEEHLTLVTNPPEPLGSGSTMVPLGSCKILAGAGSSCASFSSMVGASSSSVVPPPGIMGVSGIAVGKALELTDGSPEAEMRISLLTLIRIVYSMGTNVFSKLVQHIIVGNQIVVQPTDDNFDGCLTVVALGHLLPKGCRKELLISPEYVPPFNCNLLSLTTEATPPEADWKPTEGVYFLAVSRNPFGQYVKHLSPEEQFISRLQFKICPNFPSVIKQQNKGKLIIEPVSTFENSQMPLCPLVPQILQLLTLKPTLPASTLNLSLSALRQEWINRARILYSFKRCQGPFLTGVDSTRAWSALLASIDCSAPENANVVKFWQGALSQASRNNTCHVRRRLPTSSNPSRRGSCYSSNVDLTAVLAAATLNG